MYPILYMVENERGTHILECYWIIRFHLLTNHWLRRKMVANCRLIWERQSSNVAHNPHPPFGTWTPTIHCLLNQRTWEDFIYLQMVPHSLNHKLLLTFLSTFSSFVAYDKVSDHANWSMPSSKVLPIRSNRNLCAYGAICSNWRTMQPCWPRTKISPLSLKSLVGLILLFQSCTWILIHKLRLNMHNFYAKA